MNDQTSWQGHSFTLLIFGGVVALCSIFFILGMLVGRTQLETTEVVPAAEVLVESSDSEELDLTFYELLAEVEPPLLESTPVSQSPTSPQVWTNLPAAIGTIDRDITLQIAALSSPDQAARLQEEVRALGFAVFILRPLPDDASGLHRVQVGPLSEVEVDGVRSRLEAIGYKPIVRRK